MTLTEFKKLVSTFGKHSDASKIEVIEDTSEHFAVRLYTDLHSYNISAKPSYLGCTASTRKPCAGEEHIRGNDLADGSLSLTTWNNILADIVAYELVALAKGVKHL